MESPYKIVSYDMRTQMHEPLLNLFRPHNLDIDFARDMTDAVHKIKENQYLLMFIYTDYKEAVSPLPVVREMTNMPILVVSRQYDSSLMRHSLRLGADDYFPEPTDLQDGMLPAFAQIRRHQEYSAKKKPKNNPLIDEHILMSLEQRKVYVREKWIDLSFHEYELLRFLFANRTISFSYSQIYDAVYNQLDTGDSKTIIHNLTKRLRDKIQLEGTPQFIRTISGFGYSFDPHV